jgi:hypothetical protein
MVGIRVGGTNSGLDVGSAVAVAVELGIGVSVAVDVVVVVEDGTDDAVAVTCGPHAMNNDPITRKTKAWKRFFMLTHFLETMLVMSFALFYRQGGIVSK